jgi:hypothetical protein
VFCQIFDIVVPCDDSCIVRLVFTSIYNVKRPILIAAQLNEIICVTIYIELKSILN